MGRERGLNKEGWKTYLFAGLLDLSKDIIVRDRPFHKNFLCLEADIEGRYTYSKSDISSDRDVAAVKGGLEMCIALRRGGRGAHPRPFARRE